MPERHCYIGGEPCWADMGSPDLEVARRFYGGLFGWEIRSADHESGYCLAYLRGRAVAGLGLAASPGSSWWTTYLSVPDTDRVVRAALDAGASLLGGPVDVHVPGRADRQGRAALLADPAGAVFAVWQPGAFPGAELVAEPGAPCWNELAVHDTRRAAAFYRAVAGWESHATGPYTEFLAGGQVVAGMVGMDEQWPPEIPAHWMVYFAVADCDVAARAVAELGGTVSIAPFETDAGRVAVIDDPHGAVFSIIELA